MGRPPAPLPEDLAATLGRVIEIAGEGRQEWWIIGSAAMVLHGASAIRAADVDIITSAENARTILMSVGIAPAADGGKAHARSTIFGAISGSALPIDVMGDFHLQSATGWELIHPATRQLIALPFGAVFVPELPELIEITRRLGRPKDRERALILEALL